MERKRDGERERVREKRKKDATENTPPLINLRYLLPTGRANKSISSRNRLEPSV